MCQRQGFSGTPLTALFMGNPVQVGFATPSGGDGLVLRQTGNQAVSELFPRIGLDSDALNVAVSLPTRRNSPSGES